MIDGRLKKGETRERDGEGNERRERKEHVTWARVHYSGYIFWFTVADSPSFEPLCTVWTPTIHPGCSVYVLFGLSVCLSVCQCLLCRDARLLLPLKQVVYYAHVPHTDYTPMNCYPRDAILARYLPSSCVRLSVRPSVTSRSSTKKAKHRITQTTPYDSPRTRRRNSNGVTPPTGAPSRGGVGLNSDFRHLWNG